MSRGATWLRCGRSCSTGLCRNILTRNIVCPKSTRGRARGARANTCLELVLLGPGLQRTPIERGSSCHSRQVWFVYGHERTRSMENVMSERITAGRMQLDEQAPKLYAAVYSHTTLYHFLRRLDERGALVAALNETIRRLPKPDHHEQEPAAILAVDPTGLAPGAISTSTSGVRISAAVSPYCGVDGLSGWSWSTRIVRWVLAQEACSRALTTARRCCDHSWTLPTRLLRQGVVLADAEFDSEHNHRHVHERLAAASVIPAKRGKATWHVQGYGAKMRVASHVSCTEGERW